VRDTTDPGIITGLIMRLVGEMGTAIQPTCILKRTKDDVSFRDARIPFRRSCLWLFVRVILHMQFDRATSRPTVIPPLYKLFGLFHLTSVLLHSPVLNNGCFYLCRHGPKTCPYSQRLVCTYTGSRGITCESLRQSLGRQECAEVKVRLLNEEIGLARAHSNDNIAKSTRTLAQG
jgi:hypothetical protein